MIVEEEFEPFPWRQLDGQTVESLFHTKGVRRNRVRWHDTDGFFNLQPDPALPNCEILYPIPSDYGEGFSYISQGYKFRPIGLRIRAYLVANVDIEGHVVDPPIEAGHGIHFRMIVGQVKMFDGNDGQYLVQAIRQDLLGLEPDGYRTTSDVCGDTLSGASSDTVPMEYAIMKDELCTIPMTDAYSTTDYQCTLGIPLADPSNPYAPPVIHSGSLTIASQTKTRSYLRDKVWDWHFDLRGESYGRVKVAPGIGVILSFGYVPFIMVCGRSVEPAGRYRVAYCARFYFEDAVLG